MMLCITGLPGCSKDDDIAVDAVYQGQVIYLEQDYLLINVTDRPSNLDDEWPSVNDVVYIQLSDLQEKDFKEGQILTFLIKSVNEALIFPVCPPSGIWHCNIIILKII